jgi:hypothetical protein
MERLAVPLIERVRLHFLCQRPVLRGDDPLVEGLRDPRSQKSYIWNDDNPISYADLSDTIQSSSMICSMRFERIQVVVFSLGILMVVGLIILVAVQHAFSVTLNPNSGPAGLAKNRQNSLPIPGGFARAKTPLPRANRRSVAAS